MAEKSNKFEWRRRQFIAASVGVDECEAKIRQVRKNINFTVEDPKPYREMFELISSFGKTGDIEKISQMFQEEIDQNPTEPLGYYFQAATKLLSKSPQLEEAERLVRKAIDLSETLKSDSQKARFQILLGMIHHQRADLESAEKFFFAATQIDPKSISKNIEPHSHLR